MKHKLIVLTIFLFFSAYVLAQTNEEKHVLTLSNNKFDWLIDKQIDSLSRSLDDRLIYIHSNGWTQNKKDVIDDLLSEKLTYKKIEVSDVQIRIYPNSAIVTGIGDFSGAIDEKPFDLKLAYTEVYVLNKKRWMLASRHANRLP